MRLLEIKADGTYCLTRDLLDDNELPAYAILSHTWQDEEVTFDDFTNGVGESKAGYRKITFCAQQAQRGGLKYIWVDTCCIKKSDPIELQNAINSMFRWYRDAAKCYVFLADVFVSQRQPRDESAKSAWESVYRESRWFTRGWTLQELLAPRSVKFFSQEGKHLGDRQDLKQLISEITDIPESALDGAPLNNFEIDERISWSTKRRTTRKEDKAYSLMGIFGVYMSVIYGEGEDHAFRRLRKAIVESLDDFAPKSGSTRTTSNLHNRDTEAKLKISKQALDCLKSLAYPEQEYRYDEIHAAGETCDWLFRDPQYRTWFKSPRGLFWIKGNPGTGKSVLMKKAFRIFKDTRKKVSDELTVSFFIHGQGTDLQKTPLGVFRALLNSLLLGFPPYLNQLTTTFEDREKRYGGYEARRWSWNCTELQELLFEILTKGTRTRAVTIFIDALDECGENTAKNLLTYFTNIAMRAESQKAQVKICFSSRHYPIISFESIPAVSVEARNNHDIQLYTRERFQDVLPMVAREKFEEEILSKAQGVFQWVFLVTQTIIDGKLGGFREAWILEELASCPESLGKLYAKILQPSSEGENTQMMKLFQWVLFAERPLSAQELRDALAADAGMTCRSVARMRHHNSWSDNLVDFERHVKHISRGLIEFQSREIWEKYEPDGEDSDREAQFIHQSVADFLNDHFLTSTFCNRSDIQSIPGAAHFQISRSCLKYLTLKDVLDGFQLSRGVLSSRFPLLPYAMRFIFKHVTEVEQAGICQSDLLSLLQWTPESETVQRLSHLWRIMDPDNIHTPIGWPFFKATTFHVLIALESRSALNVLPARNAQDINSKDEDGNTPLHLAMRVGRKELVLALLDWHLDRQNRHEKESNQNSFGQGASKFLEHHHIDVTAENNEGDTPLEMALAEQDGELLCKLIKLIKQVDGKKIGSEPLFFALSSENMGLLDELIEKNVNLDGAVYFTLQKALSTKSLRDGLEHDLFEVEPILKVLILKLLNAGADTMQLSQEHAFDDNALIFVSREGLVDVVNLLLSHGVSAVSRNKMMELPLLVATEKKHKRIIQSLIEYSPSTIEMANNKGDTALDIAWRSRDMDLVFNFINEGKFKEKPAVLTMIAFEIARCVNMDLLEAAVWADGTILNMKDPRNCSLLSFVADSGDDTAVKLLSLGDEVAMNVKEQIVANFWVKIVGEGKTNMVKLVLDTREIDINAKTASGWTMLLVAAWRGHEAIVKLLLDMGELDVNCKIGQGWTPLLLAAYSGHVAVVELLLNTGKVDVNSMTDEGWTPLLFAINQEHDALVELLLNTSKVDVNLKTYAGLMPLMAIAHVNNPKIMELLLRNDKVDLWAVDHGGKTALSFATSYGKEAIAKLIIEAMNRREGAKAKQHLAIAM